MVKAITLALFRSCLLRPTSTRTGTAVKAVQGAIASLGPLPRGLSVEPIGLSQTLTETLDSLQNGRWWPLS